MPKTMLSPRQYLQDITITCQEKSMPKNDVTAKAISQQLFFEMTFCPQHIYIDIFYK